eukprot:GHUV01034826.1.p2 GENE.GHUV01034826.1~~GHUV01034826.1.p2  ORF type:complete len:100 (-),score=15.11 GHUV01034826.1:358-657(-)
MDVDVCAMFGHSAMGCCAALPPCCKSYTPCMANWLTLSCSPPSCVCSTGKAAGGLGGSGGSITPDGIIPKLRALAKDKKIAGELILQGTSAYCQASRVS